MLLPEKVLSLTRIAKDVLSIIDEIRSLDIDYATLLKFLTMFRDFLRDNPNASGKT